MNTRLTLGLVAALAATALAPATASAFPCGWSLFLDHESSGDNLYGGQFACNQAMINFWWEEYDFDQGDWDEGFGYERPCDYAEPLARTFHGLYALQYSDPNPTPNTGDFGGSILRWGANYAMREIDELDGACANGKYASDYQGLFDHYTELYPSFFYDASVPERASTIVHESRHAGGKGHGDNGLCSDGGSCDPSWGYDGANSWQAQWLWQYATNAVNTTDAMRRRARDRANQIIDGRFGVHPGFHVYDAVDRGDVYVATSSGGGFDGGGGKWHDWFCIGDEACEIGDVNGDGKDDLVAFSRGSTGDVWVALGNGSGFDGSGWKWHEAFCFGEQKCKLGDANGDGKEDLVVFDGGTTGKVWVSLSSGWGFNAGDGMWHGAFCFGTQQCEVGDANGDNKDDLIVFDNGTSGRVHVALSSGANFYAGQGVWHSAFCLNGQQCRVGDANGDNKDDLIVFDRGSTGKVWVALSSGANFYAGQGKWHDWFCVYNQQCEVGDVDGNGKDDLIVFDRGGSGDVWVAKSTGWDFNAGAGMWHDAFCHYDEMCKVGDVNGDGKTDIAAFIRH